ncbi:MAG: decaprenyl-phosphate phosphoribosyltransferase [Planctomycetes bacterium]|nr:decaprenyl-phosphate phosphoribosyltransferase [Planctomycetota bacterium]
MLWTFVRAMRPHQWVKNLLVFAPLLFTPRVRELAGWGLAGLGFLTFCLAASSIYLLNDIVDREEDARHPKKRHRPIASGALPVPIAIGGLVALLAIAAAIAWFGVPSVPDQVAFAVWPASYLALNLAYSFGLKRVIIVDCMCIALGFQLRVHAGAAAIGVKTSHWILLCTFFFALFLAFCKRYEELGRQGEASGQTRATMKDYSVPFLSMMIGPLAALSILSYSLYTVSPETIAIHKTEGLMLTVPVVTYGVFRYLFLVFRKSEGGDPAKLLFSDAPLIIAGLLYVGLVLAVLGSR